MTSVPTIDIEPLRRARSAEANGVVRQIAAAATSPGFFQIIGHGLDDRRIRAVWEHTHRFFGLDRPSKRAVMRTKENTRGYYDRELTKNRRDLKEVFDFANVPHPELPHDDPRNFAPVDGHNQWPANLPGFTETMMGYLAALERLALELLEAFAIGLGQLPRALHRHFGPDNTSFIRLNHYPGEELLDPAEVAQVAALGDLALQPHSDAGAFTLLLQDEAGGLQVHDDGGTIDVTPIEGALVVNTGDIMQVWSNDRYRAPLHSVLPTGTRERYSLPYFFNPSYATDYAPLAGIDPPPRYRTINWGRFRKARADGDFADYGTEVQISQFRYSM